MFENLTTLVINLDGADERLDGMMQTLMRNGIPFERFPAVDGRDKGPEFSDAYSRWRSVLWFGKPLNGAEVACFLSQLQAAQYFLKSGREFGLILEDDAHVKPGCGAVFNELLHAVKHWDGAPWDVLHLSRQPSKKRYMTPVLEVSAGTYSTSICRANDFPLSTSALLWTRDGAERFVSQNRWAKGTVDNILRSQMASQGTGLCLTDPIFETAAFPSQINGSDGKESANGIWFEFRQRARAAHRRRMALYRMWRAGHSNQPPA